MLYDAMSTSLYAYMMAIDRRFAWIKPDAVAAGYTDPILKRIKEER